MVDRIDTRLIAAHLSAALIAQGKGLGGGVPAADAVNVYREVLAALKDLEKQEQSERADTFINALGNEPPGG